MFGIVKVPFAAVVVVSTTLIVTVAPEIGEFVDASTTVPLMVAYCSAGGTAGDPHATNARRVPPMTRARNANMPPPSLGGDDALFRVLAVQTSALFLQQPAVSPLALSIADPLA
jgi:hypothetical protein